MDTTNTTDSAAQAVSPPPPATPSQSTGRLGEDLAAAHLIAQGWRILERNWRCPAGEIDLVALDPNGVSVLVEVKARRGTGFGGPLETITWRKQQKLRQLAAVWLGEHGPVGAFRVDALGVLILPGRAATFDLRQGILQ